MNTKSIHELKDMLCKKLDEFVEEGDISRSDLTVIKDLTESIKNLMKISEMDEGGYSYGNGSWDASGMYSNDGMSRNGMSMRTSNGRYSRDGGSYNGSTTSGMHYVRGHYSRAESENDMLAQRIEEMMQQGKLSQEDRVALYKALDIIQK